MFVILEVSKQWIFFIFPTSMFFNIWPFILLLSTNSLSGPHVSEHVDPSTGRKISVGDNVGPRLTVGGGDTVGDSVGDDKVGDDVVAI